MIFVFLGVLNGFCITLSRVFNGQLSAKYGAFHASLVNHVVGFLFLSLLLFTVSVSLFGPVQAMPSDPVLYLGGVIGALYVAVNSFVMVRLGSTNSIVMVVSGQMLFGLVMEMSTKDLATLKIQLIGALLVVLGVFLKGRNS
ncbi:DMT family transporter [Vibrio pelagius]|uniref:DMT family transporter n=1 Tax=Vibrio pelagius TaxID=28169 RepID=UPI0021C4AE72|nr:DMT family transporter [Vibrio pelagius]